MTSARQRRRKQARASLPRQIGANDNAALIANDNDPAEPVWARDPGVKETPNQRIFRQMQRRALDEAPKPVRAYDPALLTPDQEKRARRAEERMGSSDLKRSAAARDELLKIGAEVNKRIEAHKRANDNAEIRDLEALRGSQVEEGGRNEPPGRLKVTARDAMQTMHREGRITDLQYAGGLRYRARFEQLDPERGLAPLSLDGARKITRGGENWQDRLEDLMTDLLAFERSVQRGDTSRTSGAGRTLIDRIGRRLFVLREVAGKGSSIRSLSTGARERERMAQALSQALDVAVIHFRAGADESETRRIEVWRAP